MVCNFSNLQMGEAAIILKNVHSFLTLSYCGVGLEKWWHFLDLYLGKARKIIHDFKLLCFVVPSSSWKWSGKNDEHSFVEWSPLEKDRGAQTFSILPSLRWMGPAGLITGKLSYNPEPWGYYPWPHIVSESWNSMMQANHEVKQWQLWGNPKSCDKILTHMLGGDRNKGIVVVFPCCVPNYH